MDGAEARPDACYPSPGLDSARLAFASAAADTLDGTNVTLLCDDVGADAEVSTLGVSCRAVSADERELALVRVGVNWGQITRPEVMTEAGVCTWRHPPPGAAEGMGYATTACLTTSGDDCFGVPWTIARQVVVPTALGERVGVDVEARCGPNGRLLAGGCSASVPHVDLRMIRAGVRTDGVSQTDSRWLCSYAYEGDQEIELAAVAICLEPRAEGADCCAPPSEVFVRAQRARTLEATDTQVAASCLGGRTLITGSCSLDGEVDALTEVRLYRSGFGSEERTAWECGWYNDAARAPAAPVTATATAICL